MPSGRWSGRTRSGPAHQDGQPGPDCDDDDRGVRGDRVCAEGGAGCRHGDEEYRERRCRELRFDAVKLGRFDKLDALGEIAWGGLHRRYFLAALVPASNGPSIFAGTVWRAAAGEVPGNGAGAARESHSGLEERPKGQPHVFA